MVNSVKPLFVVILLLLNYLFIGCSSIGNTNDQSLPQNPSSSIKIYPAENPIESTFQTYHYRVPNCSIPESGMQTVSYNIGFSINYELLDNIGSGEVDIGPLEMDLSFALNAVKFFVSGIPEINIGPGQSNESMTVSRTLLVSPNETRLYEVTWHQEWAVGFIGVPIADAGEEIVSALININQFLDDTLGESLNTEETRTAWEQELARLREREYLIPFRMPIGLDIENISYTTEICQ